MDVTQFQNFLIFLILVIHLPLQVQSISGNFHVSQKCIFGYCYHGNKLTNLCQKCLFWVKYIYTIYFIQFEILKIIEIKVIRPPFQQVFNRNLSNKGVFDNRYHGNKIRNLFLNAIFWWNKCSGIHFTQFYENFNFFKVSSIDLIFDIFLIIFLQKGYL